MPHSDPRNTIWNDLFPLCGLCGKSMLLQHGLVSGTKAGTVHAACNLDAGKWRAWVKRKEAAR